MSIKHKLNQCILETIDVEMLAFITELKNKLEINTYKEVIELVNTCTSIHKLEKILSILFEKR